MMKHQRQSGNANFAPRLVGSSFKKKPKIKSTRMRKIAAQVNRSHAHFRQRNGSDNANRRCKSVANKASMQFSKTSDSKVSEKHQQENFVAATQKKPSETSGFLSRDMGMNDQSVPIAKSACKSNSPNISKQPTTSRLNNDLVPLPKNINRVISSGREDKTTSGCSKKSHLLKKKKGMLHKANNNKWSNSQPSCSKAMSGLVHKERSTDKSSRDKNVLDSRSKQSFLVEGGGNKHSIGSLNLNSLNAQGLPSTSKVSNVSKAVEMFSPNKEPSIDKRCHGEVISGKNMEIQSHIDGHHEQGNFFNARGNQFMTEALRNSGTPHNVERNEDPLVERIQLDGTVSNTGYVKGGRGDAAKLKRKRSESVPEKQPKAHDDYDSEDEGAEICRPTNRQRRYKCKDHRSKVTVPSVTEFVKEQHYNYSQPIDEPTWSGIFKIDSKEYVPVVAHLSTKSCDKVWTLSKSLPPVVGLTRLSRFEVWPKIWEASRPTGDNIGLYFFPHKTSPHEELDLLIKEVMENNTVLRAVIGGAEMLICPSTLLPEPYQTFQSRHYLWGVFKSRSDTVTEGEEHHGSHQQDKAQRDRDSDDDENETLLERTARLKSQQRECIGNSAQHVESSCAPGPNMDAQPEQLNRQDVQKEVAPSLAGSDAQCPPERNTEATSNQGHTGTVLAFVFPERTPDLEKLVQEMDRKGGLLFALRGELTVSGFGKAAAPQPYV